MSWGLLVIVLVMSAAGCADFLEDGVHPGDEIRKEEASAPEKEDPKKEKSTDKDIVDNYYPVYPCGSFVDKEWLDNGLQALLKWTLGGTRILFSSPSEGTLGMRQENSTYSPYSIWAVGADGSKLHFLVDAVPKDGSLAYGFYADLSPVDNRILYTSCEFSMPDTADNAISASQLANYNYEIAVINPDGTGQQRITENQYLDHYPVWSPDGSRIAFITNSKSKNISVFLDTMALYALVLDGSDAQLLKLAATNPEVAFAPPLWSPSGEYLAYVGRGINEYILSTVRADSPGERTRIGALTQLPRSHLEYRHPPAPSWSPIEDLLAFATVTLEGEFDAMSTVYTARPDGSETHELLEVPGNVFHVLWSHNGEFLAVAVWIWNDWEDIDSYIAIVRADGTELGRVQLEKPWMLWDLPYVSWSPSRPELLVVDNTSNHVFLIQADGDSLPIVDFLTTNYVWATGAPHPAEVLAAWSPEGERIALYVWDRQEWKGAEHIPFQLYTVARDGTDRRDLVTLDADGNLAPANPPE